MSLNKSHVINRLRTARTIIAKERWMKGEMCNLSKSGQVSVCAAGALVAADPKVRITGEGVWEGTYNQKLYDACMIELDQTVVDRHPGIGGIVDWNDSRYAKDKRYVLREFDATIKRLENVA